MKDIRIGNDIVVKWSIFGDGAPYILEGKDVSLYLCTPFGKRKAEGFSIVGNQITWTFAGKDQSRTGKYSLELVVNADKEGQVTTDVCNFVNLVNCSCKVGGTDESNVEIESISLTSELGFLPYDDTEIRDEIKKKQDALVSGKNIKTINGQSLLGEGDIVIESGSYDDTGIKKDISDLKENDALQDAKLAKLSLEIQQVSERVDNLPQGASMTPILYADLVNLRDNGSLVAGSFYRITDYITTTAQENTQSAGHPFDVIVLALSENTLAEEAYAIQSARDTDGYFDECNLAAWKLWYCLDNDTARFAWADAENGKGVIYRMIDEWNNDLPYDFKNIQFKRYILNADDAFATDVAKGGELEIVKAKLQEMSHKIHTNFWYYGEHISDVYPDANPDARYVPFGDIEYYNEGPQVLCEIDENNFGWFYTFHNDGEDASLLKPKADEEVGIYDNIIKDNYFVFIENEGEGSYYLYKINAQSLNNIVFVGNYCYSNSFGNDCYSNSFGNNCGSNSFGNDCYSNSFGNDCNYNTFGNICYSNSFGNNCYYNTFGNDCNYNSFGNYCYSNSFGNNCYSNSFGNYCYYNTFGNDCYSNSFGDSCNYNTFGNDCYSNSFGNDCYSNSFGNDCNYNSFGNYCYSNSFGNDCGSNSFEDEGGLMCNVIKCRIDDGINNVRFYYDNDSSITNVQNNHFCRGISNRMVEIMVTDNDYEETYSMTSDGELRYYCIADVV